MSRYQDMRRRWLPSFRKFVGSLLEDIANTSGMFLTPPPYLSGPADAVPFRHRPEAPDAGSASPDGAFAPLTASECRAWERLVREFGAKPEERLAAPGRK
jgi:hypothetical protein